MSVVHKKKPFHKQSSHEHTRKIDKVQLKALPNGNSSVEVTADGLRIMLPAGEKGPNPFAPPSEENKRWLAFSPRLQPDRTLALGSWILTWTGMQDWFAYRVDFIWKNNGMYHVEVGIYDEHLTSNALYTIFPEAMVTQLIQLRKQEGELNLQ